MKKVWLLGASEMAQDYIKILEKLEIRSIVIGRGEESAEKCRKATGCEVKIGGIEQFLLTNPTVCSHAIVSVGIEQLYSTTKYLLEYGVKNILVEKPGAMKKSELENLTHLANIKKANVLIAYNRRFFTSVIKAKEIIEDDGGVTSFNFEFTEWSHQISPLEKASGIKETWFLGNSTHVVDLAFYLGGKPKELCSFTKGSLDWHPSASIFAGAGISQNDSLFSYSANWESAGRWVVEILTKNNKLIFRPMEKLQVQKRGSIKEDFMDIDYSLDEEYKPGLYLQTKKFLENNFSNMCFIKEQNEAMEVYFKMANY